MRILTVRELAGHVSGLLEKDHVLNNLWVKGEISNFKNASSGHYYFTLKDQFSSIRVVMFRSKNRMLSFLIKNGMAVIIRGYVSLYGRDGTCQLYAEEIMAQGAGLLHVAFEQMKSKLKQEGLFDQKIKKRLPFLPHHIGIVTSLSGAVIKDMLDIISRRCPGRHLLIVPVPVQGEAAPAAIANGIEILNRFEVLDLIIIARGGGSLEELWAFNTEVVAKAIYNSKIPVISAVGHETDTTISDYVADVRAATPSVAAEIAVPDKKALSRHTSMLRERLVNSCKEKVNSVRRRLSESMASSALNRPTDFLLGTRKQFLDIANQKMVGGIENLLQRDRAYLKLLMGRLQILSPLNTLARGYSICTSVDGKTVFYDVGDVSVNDELTVLMHTGKLQCIVKDRTLN